jgi:hypothetical protein
MNDPNTIVSAAGHASSGDTDDVSSNMSQSALAQAAKMT